MPMPMPKPKPKPKSKPKPKQKPKPKPKSSLFYTRQNAWIKKSATIKKFILGLTINCHINSTSISWNEDYHTWWNLRFKLRPRLKTKPLVIPIRAPGLKFLYRLKIFIRCSLHSQIRFKWKSLWLTIWHFRFSLGLGLK